MNLFILFLIISSYLALFSSGFLFSNIIFQKLTKRQMNSHERAHTNSVTVALTREAGANDKLLSSIDKISKSTANVSCHELPCIKFSIGPDIDILRAEINLYDIIVLTSPQAASVFIDIWQECGKPDLKVVTVGKGTSKSLEKVGIKILFEPSDATGESLANELPRELGTTVLYPSSALADNSLVNKLDSRGFKVRIV